MRLGQGGVQFECPRRRLVGLREDVPRRQVTEIAEGGVGIGESGVGTRIGRVCLDRPREVLGRLLQARLAPLIPLIATLDIELVGFRALGACAQFGRFGDETIATLGGGLNVSLAQDSPQHGDVPREAALFDVGITPDLL